MSWQQYEGYYGNAIQSLSLRIEKKSEVADFLQNLFASLRTEDRHEIERSLEQRLDDDNNFFLRFDKQSAFLGCVRVGSEDTIRLQVKFSLPRKQREKILEFAIALLHGDEQ